MRGFAISAGLITGFMIGIEFAESNLLVVDLGIVRLYFEWFNEEDL